MTDRAKTPPVPKPTVDRDAIHDARERLKTDETPRSGDLTTPPTDRDDPAEDAAERAFVPRPKI